MSISMRSLEEAVGKTLIEFVETEIIYDFYIALLINWRWIITSWDGPYMNYIGLPTSSYLSVVHWNLTFPHGTDKVRMDTKIKWILTKYEAWWVFIGALSGTCG